jgi:excisionase family DNA binding protein
MDREYLSVTEVVKLFNVKSRTTIYRWIHSGKLEATKWGGRYLIHKSILELYHIEIKFKIQS